MKVNNKFWNNINVGFMYFLREITAIPATITEDTAADDTANYNGDVENYVACYPYESHESGDLIFVVGEHIKVIKKDGDWWTGVIGTRTGIFPSNYVQPDTETEATNGNGPAAQHEYNIEVQEPVQPVAMVGHTQQHAAPIYSEDAQNQEEADTEVSEINTQPITDNVQDTYSRPMSTSSYAGVSYSAYNSDGWH